MIRLDLLHWGFMAFRGLINKQKSCVKYRVQVQYFWVKVYATHRTLRWAQEERRASYLKDS